MCANIGPADYNYDETMSTLRYANRAKNIKNKAKVRHLMYNPRTHVFQFDPIQQLDLNRRRCLSPWHPTMSVHSL
jgi:hypothetical protein